jgi:hypothetical protein
VLVDGAKAATRRQHDAGCALLPTQQQHSGSTAAAAGLNGLKRRERSRCTLSATPF